MCTVTESRMTSPYGPLQVPSSTPPSDAFILTSVGGHPNRLHIPDARGQGASLRVTRHHDEGKVVLSHWRDGVCVASTPIELSEVSALIGVLADALGDAIGATAKAPPASQRERPSVLATLRQWFRPKLAQITELRVMRSPGTVPDGIEPDESSLSAYPAERSVESGRTGWSGRTGRAREGPPTQK